MGQVIANASMSLDGYIAKPDNTIGRLFEWLQNGEVEVRTVDDRITLHMSPSSAEHWHRWVGALGALMCGRNVFDVTDGWDGMHTIGVPVVVVTHQIPTDWVKAHPDAPFHFATDGVEAALAEAQEIAGEAPWQSRPARSRGSASSSACSTRSLLTSCPSSWDRAGPSSASSRQETSRWATRSSASREIASPTSSSRSSRS